jgi:hypothetical protein
MLDCDLAKFYGVASKNLNNRQSSATSGAASDSTHQRNRLRPKPILLTAGLNNTKQEV